MFASAVTRGEVTFDSFLAKREAQFDNRFEIYNANKLKYKDSIPLHFPCWLSGFTEAEGHFRLRRLPTGGINNYNFNIGQNADPHTMEMILRYYQSSNKIMKSMSIGSKFEFFQISIGGPVSRNLIYDHFEKFPLLGAKRDTYLPW